MKNIIKKFGGADGITEQPAGIDLGLASKPQVFTKALTHPANSSNYSTTISDLPFTPDLIYLIFSYSDTSGSATIISNGALILMNTIGGAAVSSAGSNCTQYGAYQGGYVNATFNVLTKSLSVNANWKNSEIQMNFANNGRLTLVCIKF